ncbi:MAG: 3-dehydroquinate synthase [Lachnospiraceae bacterium]|nr:3-dehydroquinate synthase [Lachnospiraceae bacterium]
MDNINVSYKNAGEYPVIIRDTYDHLADEIKDRFGSFKRICIITDSNVAPLYLDTVKEALSSCADLICDHIFTAGEENKNLETVRQCYDKLLANDFNRKDLVVGLGGGVTGDMAAFVSSTYMRGLTFINLPTTLLSMADSSVGGKCGVDYYDYKNMIGSIYMPSMVYMATSVLDSLPDRQYSSGMAEILKAGLIKDHIFYEWLINSFTEIMEKDPETVANMLYKAVGIKQYFVTKDPFEQNERMILNLGHTAGHAMEKYFGFSYLHGECVALGIVVAAYISYKRSWLTDEEFYEIRDMFVPFGLPISLDSIDTDSVIKNIAHDKKSAGDGIRYILLKKAGKAVIASDVTEDEIRDALGCLVVEWD